MSGYHVVAVEGQADPETMIRLVYGREAGGDPVAVDGEDGFPWGLDSDTVAVGHVRGWTLLCGALPPWLGSDDEAQALTRLSRRRRLVRWLTESTVGGVGFDVYVDGTPLRSFMFIEGEVTTSVGEPLEEEPEDGFHATPPFGLDEWEVVRVIERTVMPWEQMAEAQYQLYTLD
jgi:hypothetical protein